MKNFIKVIKCCVCSNNKYTLHKVGKNYVCSKCLEAYLDSLELSPVAMEILSGDISPTAKRLLKKNLKKHEVIH